MIELLAVIVVLAVIAIIAVPIVLNIIKRARVGAAESSARNYIKAVETYTVAGELDKSKTTLKNNQKYNVTTITTVGDKTYEAINDLVEIKGTKPSGSEDYVTLDETSSVVEAKLTINDYEIVIQDKEIVSTTSINSNDNNDGSKEEDKNNDKTTLLSEKVKVGDYVAYDAGTWDTTKAVGTDNGFGGYIAGRNRGYTSYAYNLTYGQYLNMNGWIVLKVEHESVYLIHAGIPEQFNFNITETCSGCENVYSSKLKSRAASLYLNKSVAESTFIPSADDLSIINSGPAALPGFSFVTSTYSASHSNGGSSSCPGQGYMWYCSGTYSNDSLSTASTKSGTLGYRPGVILKSTVKSSGKVKDEFGHAAWNLIAP